MKREIDSGHFSIDSVAQTREAAFEQEEEHTGLMTTIAMNIKACRRKLGWSQKELGNQAGLSLKAIGEIERGNRAVSVRSLHMISRALRVTPAELLIPIRTSISPLEDQLKRFVLQARQFQVSPNFVELCTKLIEQAAHKVGSAPAGNGNGNGSPEDHARNALQAAPASHDDTPTMIPPKGAFYRE